MSNNHLLGKWLGEWEYADHRVVTAELEITQVTHYKLMGTFILGDTNQWDFKGHYHRNSPQEISIDLKRDPPWYNVCRGTVIKDKSELLAHFFCFNPNESGYFKKM